MPAAENGDENAASFCEQLPSIRCTVSQNSSLMGNDDKQQRVSTPGEGQIRDVMWMFHDWSFLHFYLSQEAAVGMIWIRFAL